MDSIIDLFALVLSVVLIGLTVPGIAFSQQSAKNPFMRARDLGVVPGIYATGTNNAITDVEGVLVGHFTRIEGEGIRTGATAILPHGGNLYTDKVPAAVVIGNGYGKMTGISQIMELGEIETPIVLTNTLSVPAAFDAILDWTLDYPGNENVRSVNAVVGETNDGRLNDIRARVLTAGQIMNSIKSAEPGPVAEGNVGAGTGTIAFGFKGGIGTSSRKLPENEGGYSVGVLVQANFGGVLQIMGVPIAIELGRIQRRTLDKDGDGSIMIVVATDAPLSERNLERVARRALLGMSRTGSAMSNGSGDYVIAFSSHPDVRRTQERRAEVAPVPSVPNDAMSPLFQATVEATEEAVYNALFAAKDMEGHNGTRIQALPKADVRDILRRYGYPGE